MERIVRIGIIGCGGIANGKHMPSLKKLPNVQMVAFCDIIREKAEIAAQEYGTPDARVYTDYKELLKDETIEVVHVCTPNREHADMTVDALYAGKHVMCEKPMAKCVADAQRMYDAAAATGKKLTIGYQHRKKPSARWAKQYIETGALGEIYHADVHALRRRGTPNWGVFLNDEEQGGGPVIDILTHALDLTLYLMNNYEPKMVVGMTHKKIEHPEDGNIWGDNGVSASPLEDSADAMLIMKNGASIMMETSWAINLKLDSEMDTFLSGSKSGLMMRDDSLTLNEVKFGRMSDTTMDFGPGGVAFYDGADISPSDYEMQDWIDAVINDHNPIVLPPQALVISKILEGIYVSAKTGEPVYFD